MSSKSWQDSLQSELRQIRPDDRPARVAVIGIGTELNGDDSAGIALARLLDRRVKTQGNLLVVDAGAALENTSGLLRRFEPDLIILVDAAEMGEGAGSARWLDLAQAEGVSASTHTLPLNLFASYIKTQLSCSVALIGIQPAQNSVAKTLSPEVGRAVKRMARDLARLLIADLKTEAISAG